MSEYTILNVIPMEETDLSAEDVHPSVRARTYRTRKDNSLYTARYGGDVRDQTFQELLSEDDGNLVYDLPTKNYIHDSKPLCYVIIAYFEDTGDHYESTLYKLSAYSGVKEVDMVEIHNDHGEKIESYYQDEFDLDTEIRPP